ncbi:MAG TPA: inositol monophosphatase family protein [bacterium]|nr:inositol monophosphatase family protein [bacterium]
MKTNPDASYLKTAVAAAKIGGDILRRRFGRIRRIDRKGRIDIVTDADRRSEQAIIAYLSKACPDHNILAEETPAVDRKSPYTWIVDPLDGTTNYAHSYPVYAVSVGLESRGEVVAGAVFQPATGELFTAEKGKGAFLNGARIRASRVDSPDKALLVTGFPYDIAEDPGITFPLFAAMFRSAQGIRRLGSAALDLCYVACGRFDAFWEAKLKPWDTAAGALIAREAGATVTDYAGRPYLCRMPSMLASNALLHTRLFGIVRKTGRDSGISVR